MYGAHCTYVVCPESLYFKWCMPRQIVSQTTQSQILTQVAGQELNDYHKLVIIITSPLMLDSIYYLLAMFWPGCSILLIMSLVGHQVAHKANHTH